MGRFASGTCAAGRLILMAVRSWVCVGLFTEADHRLIAATKTNDEGEFKLNNIAPGQYRLVTKCEAFGAANARVRVTVAQSDPSASGAASIRTGLATHFQQTLAGIGNAPAPVDGQQTDEGRRGWLYEWDQLVSTRRAISKPDRRRDEGHGRCFTAACVQRP